jgi:hypothetical protein
MTDGFLGRWSQRKQDVRIGKPLIEPEKPEIVVKAAVPSANKQHEQAPNITATEEKPETPSPTMTDVHQLTAESDFSPFVAKNVPSEVRNSAMKKLFTDPHYNVMDRLDIYIDDYSQPDPIPHAMLRQMVSAKFLNLFKDEEEAEERAALEANKSKNDPSLGDDANIESLQSVAQSTTANLPTDTSIKTPIYTTHNLGPNDDHTDLRLQQNHAAGPHKLGRSAE